MKVVASGLLPASLAIAALHGLLSAEGSLRSAVVTTVIPVLLGWSVFLFLPLARPIDNGGDTPQQVAYGRITAGIVDATDAARLDLALGRPVLVVDSTDVDTAGEPLTTKRSRFAAERVEFLVENGL